MPEPVPIDFEQPVPLFPLQHCVMLPHATVPLHIFEPRYRAMTRDAVAGRGLIAMATFEGQQWKTQYEGKPPIRPCVCVGYLLRHEKLADGRFNILLQGLCRAKVLREPAHDPYRVGLLKPIESIAPLEIDLDEYRAKVEALLADPVLSQLDGVQAINNWISREIPTAALIDLAVMTCCPDPEDRYAMLAESDAIGRAQFLCRHLRHERARLTGDDLPDDDAPGWN